MTPAVPQIRTHALFALEAPTARHAFVHVCICGLCGASAASGTTMTSRQLADPAASVRANSSPATSTFLKRTLPVNMLSSSATCMNRVMAVCETCTFDTRNTTSSSAFCLLQPRPQVACLTIMLQNPSHFLTCDPPRCTPPGQLPEIMIPHCHRVTSHLRQHSITELLQV